MKYLKIYEIFESNHTNTQDSLEQLCDKYIKSGSSYNSNTFEIVNGIVHSSETLQLELDDIDHIPIKFGHVRSMFIEGGIKSLKNSPELVNIFNISGCYKLKSLKDGPKYIGRFLHLGSVELEDLNGFPKVTHHSACNNVGENSYTLTISAFFNKLKNILELFLNPVIEGGKANSGYFIIDHNALEIIDIFNEYDPLREDGVIILDRFNDFLIHIGKEPVDSIPEYKII